MPRVAWNRRADFADESHTCGTTGNQVLHERERVDLLLSRHFDFFGGCKGCVVCAITLMKSTVTRTDVQETALVSSLRLCVQT